MRSASSKRGYMRKRYKSPLCLLSELLLDEESAALLGGLVERIEGLDGGVPVNARVGDGDTVLESRGALGGDVLAPSVDVGLDHDTSDGGLAGRELGADVRADLGLVVVVLARVSVGAVDHERGEVRGTSLADRGTRGLDVFGRVVRALGAATQDDVDVLVAAGLDDRSETLVGNTHEGVGRGSSAHGVDSDRDGAIGTVLEADGEGHTGRELTMELGLGGASTDGTPGDEIGDVLGGDGIEQLGADGDATVGELAEQVAGDTDTLVDLEGAVDVRVVDQTLPANSRAGLFAAERSVNFEMRRRRDSQVSTHDDEEAVPLGDLGLEELSILESLGRVVDGAGPDNDEQTVILAGDDARGSEAGTSNGVLGALGGREVVLEQRGLD